MPQKESALENWTPQVLCVFGRGIEKVNGVWKPTAYIERLSESNGHPGVRVEGITPFDDDPRVVIAGGDINATALAVLYEEFFGLGSPAEVVAFAAGRPSYLANEPDQTLTEGKVMHRHFLSITDPWRATEIVFQSGNRNTRDDLAETLALAKIRRFSGIGIITVGIHIPRCQEFMKHVPVDLLEGVEIRWFASEPIVLRYLPSEYRSLWEAMISPAYTRTAERERRGIADLRAGKYNFGSQGYGFAPARP